MTSAFAAMFVLAAAVYGVSISNLSAAANTAKLTTNAGINMAQEPRSQEPRSQQPKSEQPQRDNIAHDSMTIAGKITAASGSELTVTGDDKKETRVTVTDKTRVMKAGVEGKLSDLKQNDQVTIEASQGADGLMVASVINVS